MSCRAKFPLPCDETRNCFSEQFQVKLFILDSFLLVCQSADLHGTATVRTLNQQSLLHTMTPIARRLSSTSATSAKSRATLVEIDPNLAETKESTFEATDEDLPDLPPKSNFVDHLLEMFCLKWLKISKGKSQVFHLMVPTLVFSS